MPTLSRARIASAHLGHYGAPVTLPSGELVKGILDLPGERSSAHWSEVGLRARLSQLDNPVLWLLDASAAGLASGDVVTIDATDYRITAPAQPDGSGFTRIELTPDRDSDPDARWQ